MKRSMKSKFRLQIIFVFIFTGSGLICPGQVVQAAGFNDTLSSGMSGGLSISGASACRVYVFPNPAKNGAKPVLHIEAGTADKVEIQILDFTGKVIHKETLTGGPALVSRNNLLAYAYEYEWDPENAASGAYLYRIKISNSSGETIRKGKFALLK